MIYDNQNILSYNTRHSQPYQLNHHLSDVDGLDKAYDSEKNLLLMVIRCILLEHNHHL